MPCANKGGKEDETGGKISPICQWTQAEETTSRDNKVSLNSKKNKSIAVNVDGKWCGQVKNNNKQKGLVQWNHKQVITENRWPEKEIKDPQ